MEVKVDMTTGYKGGVIPSAGAFYAPNIPQTETWQSYLRRLVYGVNPPERSQVLTPEDIVARAEKWMQFKYPGPYTVEQFYNSEKIKWDLRLKFEDPAEETMWLLRWS